MRFAKFPALGSHGLTRWVAGALLLTTSAASAIVPPPLPPGALETYKHIASFPSRDGVDEYVKLFSPSVQVTVNGKHVAGSRDAWRSYLLSNIGWSFKHRLISYGNPTLIADSVFLPSNGCCLHTRFGVYHVGDDGLVDKVTFAEGGTFWDGSLEP